MGRHDRACRRIVGRIAAKPAPVRRVGVRPCGTMGIQGPADSTQVLIWFGHRRSLCGRVRGCEKSSAVCLEHELCLSDGIDRGRLGPFAWVTLHRASIVPGLILPTTSRSYRSQHKLASVRTQRREPEQISRTSRAVGVPCQRVVSVTMATAASRAPMVRLGTSSKASESNSRFLASWCSCH
jgi:hypothetical protein